MDVSSPERIILRKITVASIFFIFLLLTSINNIKSQTIGKNYALLVAGLGGEIQYSEKFITYLENSRNALINNFKFPEANVVVLAEPLHQSKSFVNGISNAENIRNEIIAISQKVTEFDNIFIFLFGHGNYDGKNAKLNIPRRDLNDLDYANLLNHFKTNRLVFVNTACSSSPFSKVLSGPNRIIITATNRPTQRTLTVFPEYFVAGLTGAAADLDKNGKLSVLELFKYSAEHTSRHFLDNNHLPTEYAMIEDTGDRRAFRLNELDDSNDGNLAALTFFKNRFIELASGGTTVKDSIYFTLLKEQEGFEAEIVKLKSSKENYDENEYYSKLEALIVKLANLNDQLDNLKEKK